MKMRTLKKLGRRHATAVITQRRLGNELRHEAAINQFLAKSRNVNFTHRLANQFLVRFPDFDIEAVPYIGNVDVADRKGEALASRATL